MSRPQRSIRLEKRSARSLSVLSGGPGEIFFDAENETLRVYIDAAGASIILANREWVLDNTFDGDYNSLTNIPSVPSIDGLATVAALDLKADSAYVPAVSSDWSDPPPTTITEAIDRLAALVAILNGGTGA